jgi:hypothetical protein
MNINHQVMNQIYDNVSYKIVYKVSTQVWDEVWEKFGGQRWTQARNHVTTQLKNNT